MGAWRRKAHQVEFDQFPSCWGHRHLIGFKVCAELGAQGASNCHKAFGRMRHVLAVDVARKNSQHGLVHVCRTQLSHQGPRSQELHHVVNSQIRFVIVLEERKELTVVRQGPPLAPGVSVEAFRGAAIPPGAVAFVDNIQRPLQVPSAAALLDLNDDTLRKTIHEHRSKNAGTTLANLSDKLNPENVDRYHNFEFVMQTILKKNKQWAAKPKIFQHDMLVWHFTQLQSVYDRRVASGDEGTIRHQGE